MRVRVLGGLHQPAGAVEDLPVAAGGQPQPAARDGCAARGIQLGDQVIGPRTQAGVHAALQVGAQVDPEDQAHCE
jgi:hypothetical protein